MSELGYNKDVASVLSGGYGMAMPPAANLRPDGSARTVGIGFAGTGSKIKNSRVYTDREIWEALLVMINLARRVIIENQNEFAHDQPDVRLRPLDMRDFFLLERVYGAGVGWTERFMLTMPLLWTHCADR